MGGINGAAGGMNCPPADMNGAVGHMAGAVGNGIPAIMAVHCSRNCRQAWRQAHMCWL
jgi:hypothetical protein